MIKGSRWKQVNKVKKNACWWASSGVMEMFQNWIAVMVTQLHKSKKKKSLNDTLKLLKHEFYGM